MLTKLVRLGRDAELRYTNNQKAVASLACVYDIGYGNDKKSQWIDVTVWGKQAEALTPYLTKGKQIVIYADDVELEEYQKNDGSTGSKLKARAINIDLTSGGQQQSPQQAPQRQAPAQQQAPQQGGYQQQKPQANFEQGYAGQQQAPQQQPAPNADFDDDIAF